MKKKKLRSGYTTGACAAAAAKAAALLLLSAEARKCRSAEGEKKEDKHDRNVRTKEVEIPFPDGNRVVFKVHNSQLATRNSQLTSRASIIKDAGDDPDVTHGAEIVAEATIVGKRGSEEAWKEKTYELANLRTSALKIKGGIGVGTVTKPGLPVPIGEPAINPVPRKMIQEAVMEAIIDAGHSRGRGKARLAPTVEITISVPNGEELAKKTLNYRLGIVGGISILGTTGIVKPVSTEAWTGTITAAMDVAKAMGHKEIVLSAGRTSEKSHMRKYGLSEESYILMGDYLEYSLQEAEKHDFKKIHLCAQWAKMVKIAMATPQTHVRFGAIDVRKTVEFLNSLGINVPEKKEFNTAREIFDYIASKCNKAAVGAYCHKPLEKVCDAGKKYAMGISRGIPVETCLVSYNGEIITRSE